MKKEYLLFWIFPLSQLLVIAGGYKISESRTFGNIGIVLSIIADAVLLYVVFHSVKKEKIENELENVRYLKELEKERNELLEKKNRDIYEIREEFESRIQAIVSNLEAGNNQIARYDMDRLQDKLNDSQTVRYCKNIVANAVISEKQKECQKLGFSIEADIVMEENILIEPLHICSILSNMLDNAIEAVKEISLEKRKIIIKTETKGGFLFIKTINPTTKKYALRPRRKDHGYGTQILTELAEKYDGKYEGIYRDGYYSSTVMIRVM